MSKYNIIQTIRFKCLRLWMLKLISPKFPQNGPTVPQYSLDVITAPFQALGAPHLSSKNQDPAQCHPDQCWGISPPPQHTWIGKYIWSRRKRELKKIVSLFRPSHTCCTVHLKMGCPSFWWFFLFCITLTPAQMIFKTFNLINP